MLGLIQPDGDDDHGWDEARRKGWRDVAILWVLLLLIVLIVVL